MTTIDLTRRIACDGVCNLRDLGGYHTSDGRTVRWRTIFRADGLHRIPNDGLATVRELGWRTVFDLRTFAEVEAGRYSCDGVDVLHLPMLRETWDRVAATTSADPVEFLAARYLEMTEQGAPAIAAVLEMLASRRRLPAVFHCAAGKDRTGVLAALVLAALGVDDEQIAVDYNLSAVAMDRLVEWIARNGHPTAEAMARQPGALLACPPEAILVFLRRLRERHGSVDRYLAGIGVGHTTTSALQDAVLAG